MRLTIGNLFLGTLRGRFGRHPCTKAPAIEPAICGASVAADGGYMSRWRERGKVATDVIPGRALWREPGIHFSAGLRGSMDSGLALRAPRNDQLSASHRHLPMQHRGAGGEAFGGIDDGVGIQAVVAVQVGECAGLAELLDAERLDAVAANTAEPAERSRMAVDHGHD